MRILAMQVLRRVKECMQLAEMYFQRSFVMPDINYHVRGQKAGVAYLAQNEVRFNPILLQENTQDFIHQVVPHEVAHIIAYQQFGRVKPHGMEWQNIMKNIFGLPPEVRHQFDTTNTVKHVFTYHCGCQIHHLTVRRHNKIVRDRMRYICKKCGGTLRKINE